MGVVTDPSSAVVPDASVEIRNNAKGAIQATKTDREASMDSSFWRLGGTH